MKEGLKIFISCHFGFIFILFGCIVLDTLHFKYITFRIILKKMTIHTFFSIYAKYSILGFCEEKIDKYSEPYSLKRFKT